MLSVTDSLTGLYNRSKLDAILIDELARYARTQRQFALLMLDIDYFKTLNDTHGHVVGDEILKDVARILLQSIRSIDYAARYGGDEFLIILPEATLEVAKRVGERIRENLLVYQENVGEGLPPLTASIGLISFEGIGRSAEIQLFIEKMDQALLLSKGGGKNRITVL